MIENEKTIIQYIEDGTIKHDLKIAPEYFKDVVISKKKFELRKNDRDFQIGDIFVLREWDGREYTGNYFVGTIGYVLKNCAKYGLMDGYCIFGW